MLLVPSIRDVLYGGTSTGALAIAVMWKNEEEDTEQKKTFAGYG
jgi:hypothetical protein